MKALMPGYRINFWVVDKDVDDRLGVGEQLIAEKWISSVTKAKEKSSIKYIIITNNMNI